MDAQERERERPHGAQQHHVLARDGHDVEQAAGPERVDGLLPHALVVAEDHALQHLGHGRAHAGEQVRSRRLPQPVHQPLQPAAAAGDGEVREVRLEQHVLPAAPQVPAVVEGSRPGLGQGLDAHRAQPHQGALGERPRGVVPEGLALLQPQSQVSGLADGHAVGAGHPDGQRDQAVLLRRQVGEDGRERHVVAGVRGEGGAPDGVQPGASERKAGDDEDDRQRAGDRAASAARRRQRRARAAPATTRPAPVPPRPAEATATSRDHRRPPREREAEAGAVGGHGHVRSSRQPHRGLLRPLWRPAWPRTWRPRCRGPP